MINSINLKQVSPEIIETRATDKNLLMKKHASNNIDNDNTCPNSYMNIY